MHEHIGGYIIAGSWLVSWLVWAPLFLTCPRLWLHLFDLKSRPWKVALWAVSLAIAAAALIFLATGTKALETPIHVLASVLLLGFMWTRLVYLIFRPAAPRNGGDRPVGERAV